jgi:hypothetical protein
LARPEENHLYGLFPLRRYQIAMFARFALVLFAVAATISSARAADLGGFVAAPGAVECNCGSPMITVYDDEPGVVTRHWAECECRYEPFQQRARTVAGTVGYPAPEFYGDPWRRW